MKERGLNIFQKIKKHNSVIIFIVFSLGAIAAFVFSFFSSPELIVSLRLLTLVILLVPLAFLFIFKPLISLLSGGIFGDRRVLKKLLTENNPLSS